MTGRLFNQASSHRVASFGKRGELVCEARSYGTEADHPEESPDSNPSTKIPLGSSVVSVFTLKLTVPQLEVFSHEKLTQPAFSDQANPENSPVLGSMATLKSTEPQLAVLLQEKLSQPMFSPQAKPAKSPLPARVTP